MSASPYPNPRWSEVTGNPDGRVLPILESEREFRPSVFEGEGAVFVWADLGRFDWRAPGRRGRVVVQGIGT